MTVQPDRIDPNEESLIAAAAAGDEAAFESLVHRHQRQVYRIAYAIVQDESEADNVTQDTFVKAYTHLREFQGRSQFETWLTRIAINRARDILRRRKGLRLLSLTTAADDEAEIDVVDGRPDPERQLLASELGAAIARAETRLSAKQKLIFRLRHHADLPLEEIADQLGLRAATVRVHLFRALRKIRQELSGWRQPEVNTETIDVRAFQ